MSVSEGQCQSGRTQPRESVDTSRERERQVSTPIERRRETGVDTYRVRGVDTVESAVYSCLHVKRFFSFKPPLGYREVTAD